MSSDFFLSELVLSPSIFLSFLSVPQNYARLSPVAPTPLPLRSLSAACPGRMLARPFLPQTLLCSPLSGDIPWLLIGLPSRILSTHRHVLCPGHKGVLSDTSWAASDTCPSSCCSHYLGHSAPARPCLSEPHLDLFSDAIRQKHGRLKHLFLKDWISSSISPCILATCFFSE